MDELLTTTERDEFINEILQKRGLIRAKYWSWQEPRNGLIVYAAKTWLRVLFLTGVNVATGYYTIKIEEVKNGLWEMVYSNDFLHFYQIKGGKAQEDMDLETAVRNIFKGGDDNGGDSTIPDEG